MKIINNWIKKHSVQTSIIIFILSFALIASAVSLVASEYFMSNFVVEGYLTDYLQLVYSDFENNFKLVVEQINMFNIGITTWQDLYLSINNKDIAVEEKQLIISNSVERLLDKQKYNIIDGVDICVDGHIYRYAKEQLDFETPAIEFSDRPEYSLSFYNGKLTSGEENYIAVATKYYNYYNNYNIGHIVVYIKESYLFSLYGNSLLDNNEFFITVDGKVMSHTDKSKLGTEVYIPNELYSDENLSVNRYSNSIIGKFQIIADNINSDICMITIVKADKLFGIVDKINLYIFMSLGTLFIIAVYTAILVTRRFVKQHVNIRENIERIEKFPYEAIEFDTKNELQILENSFSKMSYRISQLMKQKDEANEAQRIAEMKALQVHINPHFIYNALDVITCFAKCKGEKEIENMTYALASYFRIGLSGGKTLISISDELKHVRSYIDIEMIRFPDMFDVEYDVPEEISNNYEIVKITLQPLVENAVKHGFCDMDYKGHIRITARFDGRDIIFIVSDNGCGYDVNPLQAEKTFASGGYGLTNVQQRLQFEYGDDYGLSFSKNTDGGTDVMVRIAANKIE